jgi:hypothetical protein
MISLKAEKTEGFMSDLCPENEAVIADLVASLDPETQQQIKSYTTQQACEVMACALDTVHGEHSGLIRFDEDEAIAYADVPSGEDFNSAVGFCSNSATTTHQR